MKKVTLYIEDHQKEHILKRVGGKFFNSTSHYMRKLIQDDINKKLRYEKFSKARMTISEMECGPQ